MSNWSFTALVVLFFSFPSSSFHQDVNHVANGVQLTSSPSHVVSEFTSSLEIRCSFRRDADPSLSSVLSVSVSHSNVTDQSSFSYIASVNAVEGHAHNVAGEVSEVSGSIDSNGESFLYFKLKEPVSDKTGVYKCEVTGFDHIGKPLTLSNTLAVVESRATAFDIVNEIQKKKVYINNQRTFINKLKSRLDAMKDELFYSSQPFNGTRYYIIKKLTYYINSEAQAVCELFGGYLAEIDTHEEFLFVRDFIMRANVFQLIFTGATDEEHEGVWINKHNMNARPTFDWALGRPTLTITANCQCFDKANNWFFSDCYCDYKYSSTKHLGYICEIPD